MTYQSIYLADFPSYYIKHLFRKRVALAQAGLFHSESLLVKIYKLLTVIVNEIKIIQNC